MLTKVGSYYVGLLILGKKQHFVLLKHIGSAYRFTFPAYNAYKMPYPLLSYSYSNTSDQGIYLTAKEIQQLAYAHGIHWSYLVPNHPEAAGLTELAPTMWQQPRGLGVYMF